MKPEIKKMWVEALRSGKYAQGKGRLRGNGNNYCCLGVLCDLAVNDGVCKWIKTAYYYSIDDKYASNSLPPVVQSWAGLEESDPRVAVGQEVFTLIQLNDSYALGFDKIADMIEKYF